MSRLMTDNGQRTTDGRNVKIELEFWKQNSQYSMQKTFNCFTVEKQPNLSKISCSSVFFTMLFFNASTSFAVLSKSNVIVKKKTKQDGSNLCEF